MSLLMNEIGGGPGGRAEGGASWMFCRPTVKEAHLKALEAYNYNGEAAVQVGLYCHAEYLKALNQFQISGALEPIFKSDSLSLPCRYLLLANM